MTSTRRRLLRAKARLGRWDHRYLDYYAGIPHVIAGDPALRRFVMRGFGKHGLVVTATNNGTHAVSSFHYLKRAVDMGLVPAEIGTSKGQRRMRNFQLDEFREYQRGKRPNMQELIGPDNNAIVLRGAHTPLAEGTSLEQMHDNHVHGAF